MSIDQFFENAEQTSAGNYIDDTQQADYEQLIADEEAKKQAAEAAQAQPQPESDTSVAGKGGPQRGGQEGLSSASKWVDENIGIPFEHTIRDTVGKLLGGEGISADEVAQQRAEGQERMGQEIYDFNQTQAAEDLRNNPLVETARVIGGGATGAVEAALQTAEIVGDTVKTFSGLAEESDNVFNNKYEWAKWDLGKDTAGAQTGAGKIAQGFAEFGILMAGTGGFSAVGAGAGIAKTAAHGALSGLAADMISASGGEGNLSNLIKKNAPDWYPTWLTALAVDEDDNPWEAMLKTGLEGGIMGGSIDAVMAYLSGARAGGNAINAGNTHEQAQEIALQASSARLASAPKADPVYGPLAEAAMASDNVDQFGRMRPLMDQEAKGIPIYYDDVASSFPEYFTIPGAGRVVPDDFNPAVYEQLSQMDVDGGLSINPFTGEVPTSGHMVAIDGAVLENVTPDNVANFIARNRDILSRNDVYLGSWVSKETGQPVVELSRLVADGKQAEFLGRAFDQEGIFRLDDFEFIPTDGTDVLRKTKGGHMTSASKVANSGSIPTDATKAYKQQQQGRVLQGVAAPSGAGRSITDAQLSKIARSVGDDAAAVLADVAARNPVDVKALAKASKTTVDEIARDAGNAIAESLDAAGQVDWTKIRKQAVGGDTLLDQVGIVQVRGMMQETSNRAFEVSKQFKAGYVEGSDVAMQFDNLVDSMKGLLRIHKESANAYSRYLSTYKIEVPALGKSVDFPNGVKPQQGAELATNLDEVDKALDQLKLSMKSGDPEQVAKASRVAEAISLADGDVFRTLEMAKNANKIATAQVGQELLTLMYNSMLSSPTTHAINNLSNAINTMYRPVAAYVGGDAKAKRMAISSFYSFGETLQESWDMAARSLKDPAAVQGSKTGIQAGQADQTIKQFTLAAEMSDDVGVQAASGWINTLHEVANFPLFSWPSKLMTTSDEFFKAMVARMEFKAQTMGAAIDSASASGSPLDQVFSEMLEKTRQYNIAADGRIVNEDLLDAAKEVTYQTALEGWAKGFADFVHAVPILRPFFPFVKTGHNIMAFTGEHVPFLSSHLVESKAIMNGTDEYAKAILKGRQATGRIMVLTAATAAFTGTITGNGPPDPQERKEWLKNNQPRSFKLPDGTFVDYSRIEPLGQIFSAVADLVDISKYAVKYGLGQEEVEYMAGYLTYAISNNFTNKTYMQGVVPLGKMLTPGWQGMSSLATLAPETINNFIPLSGARRAFNNLMTPYMMEYNNLTDRFWSQATGGLVQLGTPAHDYMSGEQMDSPSGGANGLSPIKVVKRNTSPARDAMEDIGFNSSVIMKTIGGVKLTGAQKSRMQELMGTDGKLEKKLNKIVTTKTWIAAKDKWFKESRSGATKVLKQNTIWYQDIERTILEARDAAISALKEEDPDLMMQITDKRITSKPQRTGVEATDNSDYLNYLDNMTY